MYCEKFYLLDYGNASFSRIGSTLVRSSAPSKIYGSLEFDAKGFDVLVREEGTLNSHKHSSFPDGDPPGRMMSGTWVEL